MCRTLATVASAKLAQTHDARGVHGVHRHASFDPRAPATRGDRRRAGSGGPVSLDGRAAPRFAAVTVLVIGADRGLCGGHNLALGRAARAFILDRAEMGIDVSAVVKGRRAETYLRRTTSVDIVAASDWTRAGVNEAEVSALLAAGSRCLPRWTGRRGVGLLHGLPIDDAARPGRGAPPAGHARAGSAGRRGGAAW